MEYTVDSMRGKKEEKNYSSQKKTFFKYQIIMRR
jgi:hypothetical protein